MLQECGSSRPREAKRDPGGARHICFSALANYLQVASAQKDSPIRPIPGRWLEAGASLFDRMFVHEPEEGDPMTDGFEQAKAQRNALERLGAMIPGFRGFQDRELRRD